jgi:aspartokinase
MNKHSTPVKEYGFASAQQDIDPSLQETLATLQEKWMLYNLNVELAIVEGKRIIQSKEHRKIQVYSLSSANRRKFMMYLIRSTAESDKLTVTEVTKLLGIARNSVETMVKECSENGWITITRCKKKHKHMTANDNLMNCYRGYSKWLWQQVHQSGLRSISEDIAKVVHLQRSVASN